MTGCYYTKCSDSRTFLIKPKPRLSLGRSVVRFYEGGDLLFVAILSGETWKLEGRAVLPDLEMRAQGVLTRRWVLTHGGESFSEEHIKERMGIDVLSTAFPDSHLVRFSDDAIIYEALAFGALMNRFPD